MATEIWLTVAVMCNVAGYLFYWRGIRRHLVKPNRSSWLIWSVATAIEALTYQALNEGMAQNAIFIISSAACLAVTIAVWRQSAWKSPTVTESLCMALALAALVLWFVFQSALWAHLLVVVAVPISFIPTWISAWKDRRHERSPAWGLWTIGDLATVLVIALGRQSEVTELPYILVELVCHASMWFMIGLLSINPFRSFGFGGGRFYVLDVDKQTANVFAIGSNHLGQAVYAARGFEEGASIIRFTGPVIHKSELPSSVYGTFDRFVQVDRDHYMGPSGEVDDLINHSCEPNGGLRFADTGITLVAIRPIAEGDEITWDYSTTLFDSGWRMECHCHAPSCRHVIGDFALLDPALRQRYRALDVVPPYLRATQEELADEAARIPPLRAA